MTVPLLGILRGSEWVQVRILGLGNGPLAAFLTFLISGTTLDPL